MLNTIQYIRGTNAEEKTSTLGAKVIWTDNGEIKTKEFYVGLRFDLEDILENEVNARAIKVTNKKLFEEQYKQTKAVGIVFFPQTDKYAFLHEGDEVIQWITPESVDDLIDHALEPYKKLPIEIFEFDTLLTRKNSNR